MNGLVVEAFGTPGVGKSHVIRKLVEVSREKDIPFRTESFGTARQDRPARVLRKLRNLCAISPVLLRSSFRLVALLRRTKWSSRAEAGRALFNWAQLLGLIRRRARNEPLLLQQGIVQAIWSLLYRFEEQRSQVELLGDWWDLSMRLSGQPPMLILVVEARDEIVLERLRSRRQGMSILDSSDRADWARGLRCTANMGSLLSERADGENTIEVLRLPNAGGETGEKQLDVLLNGLVAQHLGSSSKWALPGSRQSLSRDAGGREI